MAAPLARDAANAAGPGKGKGRGERREEKGERREERGERREERGFHDGSSTKWEGYK